MEDGNLADRNYINITKIHLWYTQYKVQVIIASESPALLDWLLLSTDTEDNAD